VTITVAPAPLQITTGSLGSAVYRQAYQSQLAVSGGTGNVAWSQTGGALPSGVSLDPGGAVSGAPTAIGSFTVSVHVADANWPDNHADASLVLLVTAPVLAVTVSAPSSAQVGVPYQGSAAVSGLVGSVAWTVSAGALPPGIVLNAASGAIAGIPTVAGVFTAVIQARDSYGASRVSAATLDIVVAPSSTEIVLYAADAPLVSGTWSRVADATAAGGARLWNPDKAAAKLAAALAVPVSYFEMTFTAQAGVAYHLWMRGKADKNSWANDSVYVQFSGSVDAGGAAQYRIGTTSSTFYSVEDGSNAGLAGWGWNDDSYSGLAAPVYFAATGPQTIRIQVREDGLSLDQIVLSSGIYLTAAPGAFKNDATILPR
jgi:putative Ig domain-containing protein